MENFLALLAEYGPLVYVLLFLYCSLKSGLLPLFAGFAAYEAALDVNLVLVTTFAGGYLGDELRFAIARRYGSKVGARWPRVQEAINRARILMDRYGAWYIFIYRYPKGMRTIGAIPVGIGEMPWAKFTLFNAASAALWTIFLVLGGYLFGDLIASTAESGWGAISIALLLGFLVVTYIAWRRVSRTLISETI
ncbi:MAG: DedA family protein [Alphaproteobacteria bacterium]